MLFPTLRFTFARLRYNVLRPVVGEETGIVLFCVAHRLPLDRCAVRRYSSEKKRWPERRVLIAPLREKTTMV